MLQFYSSSNGLVNSDKAMRECLASALAGLGDTVGFTINYTRTADGWSGEVTEMWIS